VDNCLSSNGLIETPFARWSPSTSAYNLIYLHALLCYVKENLSFFKKIQISTSSVFEITSYQGAGKSLARPRRKQNRNHVWDARDFNNIETRAIKSPPPPQGKAPKEIHAILTGTLACFLPGRFKDLSAPLYYETRWKK